MKRIILAVSFLFSLVSYIIADVELGINFGYGFPANTTQTDGFWGFLPEAEYKENRLDSSAEFSEYKDLYYSFGKGIKACIDLTIYFNNNFGFYLGSGFSFLGSYNIENTSTYQSQTTTYNFSFKSNFLSVNAGLKFKSDIGNFSPYVYVAPGVCIPVGVNSKWETEFGGGTDTYSIKFDPGFGVASGIGAKIKVSDSFGFKFEFSPVFASARVKEIEMKSDGSFMYKDVFIKNEADLPDNTLRTFYHHGGPKYSFSSLSANIGIVIGF